MYEAARRISDEPDGREPLLTARQVAQRLNVSVGWVSAHAAGKYLPRLPCYRLGGALRFKWSEIEEFLARCKEAMDRGLPIQ